MTRALTYLFNTTPSIQRIIAIVFGILTICCTAIITTSVYNLIDRAQINIIEKRKTLGRMERAVNPKTFINEDNDYIKLEKKIFLPGENESIIRAELQAKISNLVTSNDLTIASTSNIKTQNVSNLKLVGITIELTGKSNAVHKFLTAIETVKPSLITRNFLIRAQNRGLQQNKTKQNLLSLRLEVFGLVANKKILTSTGALN